MKDRGVFYRSTRFNMTRIGRPNAREWIDDHQIIGVVVHATFLSITAQGGHQLTASFSTRKGTAAFVQKHLADVPRTCTPDGAETCALIGD